MAVASVGAAPITLREGLAEPRFYPGGYTGTADNTPYVILPEQRDRHYLCAQ